MARYEPLYLAKKDMTLAGRKVNKGQLVRPAGGVNDHLVFGDNTLWVSLWHGRESEALTCGSDGCPAVFANLGLLDRHRQIVHAPEREYRLRAQREAIETEVARERSGETVGGLPVEYSRNGPGGPVPYVRPALE